MEELDNEERLLLSDGVSALLALGERVPSLVAAAEEVMDRELAEIQPTTVDNVRWSFVQLFDASAAYYLVRYLTADDAEQFLQLFLEKKPAATATPVDDWGDEIEVELRRLQALYGQRMGIALRTWNTTPDDWSGTTREVAYDLATQTYKIRFQIQKNNGEQFNLVCEPASILNLTTSLVRTLNFLPDPSGIAESIVADFRNEVTRLLDAFGPAPALPEPTRSATPPSEGVADPQG